MRRRLVLALTWSTGAALSVHFAAAQAQPNATKKPSEAKAWTAPRTADGKPDLTGLWSGPPLGGATVRADPTDLQPWAKEIQRQRREEFFKGRPQYQCQPMGPEAFEGQRRIIQTPTMIAILNADLTYRQIFLDGRPLESDPFPVWMGYSVGHWEGDTLVVDSLGFNDRTWLNSTGLPHTEHLRMTERYRRADFGHLNIDVTFEDPGAFTRPLHFTIAMQFMPDTEMLEQVCEDKTHWVARFADFQRSAVRVPENVLKGYVGVYSGRWGERPRTVNITLDDGDLWVTSLTSSEQVMLAAQSETVFTSAEGISYEFFKNANGIVTRVEEIHASGNYSYRRQ